jgi:hypothetical protein
MGEQRPDQREPAMRATDIVEVTRRNENGIPGIVKLEGVFRGTARADEGVCVGGTPFELWLRAPVCSEADAVLAPYAGGRAAGGAGGRVRVTIERLDELLDEGPGDGPGDAGGKRTAPESRAADDHEQGS